MGTRNDTQPILQGRCALHQEFFAEREGFQAQTWIYLTEEVLASNPPGGDAAEKALSRLFCVEKVGKAGRIS
jgi:hypothetical protein